MTSRIHHVIHHRRWPLGAVIVVAALASLATSYVLPPPWTTSTSMRGRTLVLDGTEPTDASHFTIHGFSEEERVTSSTLTRARLAFSVEQPVTVTITLMPDNGDPALISQQIHTMSGTGQTWLSLTADQVLGCDESAPLDCEHGFTMMLDTDDEIAGEIRLDWSVQATLTGYTEEPQAASSIAITPDRDVPPQPEVPLDPSWNEYGRIHESSIAGPDLSLTGSSRTDTMHFVVRPRDGVSYDGVSLHGIVHYRVDSDEPSGPLRVVLTPDDTARFGPIERVFSHMGSGIVFLDFDVLTMLACADQSGLCEQGFTLTFELEGDAPRPYGMFTGLDATESGSGAPRPSSELIDVIPGGR